MAENVQKQKIPIKDPKIWEKEWTKVASDKGLPVVTSDELEQPSVCGTGGYSVVTKVTHGQLGCVVYKKVPLISIGDNDRKRVRQKKQRDNERMKLQFDRELRLHIELSHRNVVQILGVIPKPESFGLLLEFMDHNCLRSFQGIYEKRINWQFRIHLLLEAAEGLEYIHQLKPPIVHSDLKSDNLLVDRDFTIKV